jgi:hypothetical protein
MATMEMAQTENTTASKRVRRMFGLDLDAWNAVMVSFLGIAAVAAVVVGVSTAIIIRLQKQADLESKEIIAKLNNDTARLMADNLALQTVMLPRHAGIFGVNGPPQAETWFVGMGAFAGVPFVIQPTDDNEARNLASEIVFALAFFGVKANIDEGATSLVPSRVPEGVSVAYATGKPWTKEEPNQPWFEWAKAANALADSLTKAGLGVGDFPVQRYGFVPVDSKEAAAMNFKTIREGVLVYVGQRPVSQTIAWIKQGRPDAAGNKAADAVQAEPHK